MIAYIDTSALLRIILREPGALDELRSYDTLVAPDEAAVRSRVVTNWFEAIDLVLLRPPVLSRASEPMPMALGTLDAVHLATALIWRDRVGPLPAMATHDTAPGSAARAFGFEVLGI